MAFLMLGAKPYLTVLNVKTFAKFSFFSHAIYMLLFAKALFVKHRMTHTREPSEILGEGLTCTFEFARASNDA